MKIRDATASTLCVHVYAHGVCTRALVLFSTTGAVLGVCMCHPGSQESLQDWLTALQETYPTLAKATVIYNIRKTESPSSSDSNLQLPPHRTRLTSGELGSIEECVTNIQQSHEYY